MTDAIQKAINVINGAKAWLVPDKTTSYSGSVEDWGREANDVLLALRIQNPPQYKCGKCGDTGQYVDVHPVCCGNVTDGGECRADCCVAEETILQCDECPAATVQNPSAEREIALEWVNTQIKSCEEQLPNDPRFKGLFDIWHTIRAALGTREGEDWQPIESAPRDKGRLFGINMNGSGPYIPFIMMNTFEPCEKFTHAAPGACWKEPGKDWPCYPTHWLPLDALPSPPLNGVGG